MRKPKGKQKEEKIKTERKKKCCGEKVPVGIMWCTVYV